MSEMFLSKNTPKSKFPYSRSLSFLKKKKISLPVTVIDNNDNNNNNDNSSST